MGTDAEAGLIHMCGESTELFIREAAFSLFLAVFAWQDICRKRIRVRWLYGFGTLGAGSVLIRCIQVYMESGWNWKQLMEGTVVWLLGMAPGILLLWIERQTKGGIGRGDGYFFLIAGCYLGGWRTLELLAGSIFVSSLAGGIWMLMALLVGKGSGLWEQMRKKKLPFLPCVIPVWLGMLFLPVG